MEMERESAEAQMREIERIKEQERADLELQKAAELSQQVTQVRTKIKLHNNLVMYCAYVHYRWNLMNTYNNNR